MNKKLFLFALAAVFMAAACMPLTALEQSQPTESLPATPTAALEPSATMEPTPEPPPADPTATFEPTPEPTPTREAVSGIKLNVPDEVAAGFAVAAVPALEGEEFFAYPGYRSVEFTDYRLAGAFHNARIEVYPVEEYAEMNSNAAQEIVRLRSLLDDPQARAGDEMPFLPLFNAAQTFTTKPEFLDFANGRGVRYLTQYAQSFYPIVNQHMFYTFQGITSDGKYYVAAVLPEGAPILPDDYDPEAEPPEGGVAFPDWESPTFDTELQQYFETITQVLDETPGENFTIPLQSLDAMIRSLEVTKP